MSARPTTRAHTTVNPIAGRFAVIGHIILCPSACHYCGPILMIGGTISGMERGGGPPN